MVGEVFAEVTPEQRAEGDKGVSQEMEEHSRQSKQLMQEPEAEWVCVLDIQPGSNCEQTEWGVIGSTVRKEQGPDCVDLTVGYCMRTLAL